MHIYLYIYIYICIYLYLYLPLSDEDKEGLVYTQPVSLVYICLLYNNRFSDFPSPTSSFIRLRKELLI